MKSQQSASKGRAGGKCRILDDDVARHFVEQGIAQGPSWDWGENWQHRLSFAFCGNVRSNMRQLTDTPLWLAYENFLCNHQETETKDGPAVICAMLNGGRRNSNVICVTALGYEIDGKLTVEEAVRILEAAGIEAILYTSFNHLRTTQSVTCGTFNKWQGSTDHPTEESVRRFCAQDRRYNHLMNVRLADSGKSRRKQEYSSWLDVFDIAHDPEHKFRIVFPLAVPILIKDGIGVEGYKALYLSVGRRKLGDAFSTESQNANRVHYLPAHRPGAQFDVRHFPGVLLDGNAEYKRIEPEIKVRREAAARTALRPRVGLEEVAHCLSSISAGCEYPDWFAALCVIHHESSGSEEGRVIAHEWSSEGDGYNERQVDAIWDSLDPDHPNPKTIRSLTRLACSYDPNFIPKRPRRVDRNFS